MPSELPDPIRPIRLDRTSQIDAVPDKPRIAHADEMAFDAAARRLRQSPFGPRELPTVEWLKRRGVALDRVEEHGSEPTPDAVLLSAGATVEFKAMDRASANSLRRQVRDCAPQSRHLVIDGRNVDLGFDSARDWLAEAIRTDGHYLDQVIVVLGGRRVAPVEWSRVR